MNWPSLLPETRLPPPNSSYGVMPKRHKALSRRVRLVIARKVAAAGGNRSGLELAGIDARDSKDRTLLMIAASRGMAKLCADLIRAGAKVDERDKQGATALLYASGWPHYSTKTVQTLIEHGANVNLATRSERSPLRIASFRTGQGNIQCTDLRISRERKTFARIARMLLEAGATDDLCLATMRSDVAAARIFLNRGADPNEFKWGAPPLSFAFDSEEMTRLLLGAGADPDGMGHRAGETIPREGGFTPLMCAADMANSAVINALLEAGADVNARRMNRTPLIWSAILGKPETVRLLLEVGADPTIEDGGMTTLDWAREWNFQTLRTFETLQLLESVMVKFQNDTIPN